MQTVYFGHYWNGQSSILFENDPIAEPDDLPEATNQTYKQEEIYIGDAVFIKKTISGFGDDGCFLQNTVYIPMFGKIHKNATHQGVFFYSFEDTPFEIQEEIPF